MTKYRIDISEPAENDLRDIIRYIFAQLSAPVTAQKMMDIVEEAIANLAVMPQKCPPVTDKRLARIGYRKLIVKNYIIFFTVNEEIKVVDVERILFARRNWRHIL
jgi:plasmid stabilization system protein ParE